MTLGKVSLNSLGEQESGIFLLSLASDYTVHALLCQRVTFSTCYLE